MPPETLQQLWARHIEAMKELGPEWEPVGWMKFRHQGQVFDLSATDLSKRDLIVKRRLATRPLPGHKVQLRDRDLALSENFTEVDRALAEHNGRWEVLDPSGEAFIVEAGDAAKGYDWQVVHPGRRPAVMAAIEGRGQVREGHAGWWATNLSGTQLHYPKEEQARRFAESRTEYFGHDGERYIYPPDPRLVPVERNEA
jgi:hypothetical protein